MNIFLEKNTDQVSKAIQEFNPNVINDIINSLNIFQYKFNSEVEKYNLLLDYSTYYCDYETSISLINRGAEVTSNNNSAIIHATLKNNIVLVKKLIELGADPNITTHETPYGLIGKCASYGYLDLMKYFISIGCDFKLGQDGAFRDACLSGHLDCAKYLLSLSDVDLHSNQEQVINLLIKKENSDNFLWYLGLSDKKYNYLGNTLSFIINKKRYDLFEYLHDRIEFINTYEPIKLCLEKNNPEDLNFALSLLRNYSFNVKKEKNVEDIFDIMNNKYHEEHHDIYIEILTKLNFNKFQTDKYPKLKTIFNYDNLMKKLPQKQYSSKQKI